MQDLNKKISEFQEIETFGDNAVIPVVQGNPLDNYKITPENLAKGIIDDVQTEVGKRFLSKVLPDYALERITFNKGITSNGVSKLQDTEFGTYQSGIHNGSGGRIDSEGNAELTSLTLRAFLEVPEIRYNRLTLIGDEVAIGTGAVIENVEEVTGGYNITLKLEEGELNPFWVDDIIKGIFHQLDGGENGLAGFYTSWFRVNVVEGAVMKVTLAPESKVPKNFAPQRFMNIARWGNFTVKERQSVMFLSAKTSNIVIIDGIDDFGAGYISAQWGKPAGLENVIDFDKNPINVNDSYLYARGLIYQDAIRVDYKGKPIKEYRDRDVWSAEIAASITDFYVSNKTLQDEVWYKAEKYRCLSNATLEIPSRTSQDWLMVLSLKDEIIEQTAPPMWIIEAVNKIDNAPMAIASQSKYEELQQLRVIPKITRNGVDVTALMNTSPERFYEFQRVNIYGVDDKGVTDTAWNTAHLGRTEVMLTHLDIMFVGKLGFAYDDELLETEYQRLK